MVPLKTMIGAWKPSIARNARISANPRQRREAEIEHDQVDVLSVPACVRQQCGRIGNSRGAMADRLQRRPETIAHERGVVGDDDGL